LIFLFSKTVANLWELLFHHFVITLAMHKGKCN